MITSKTRHLPQSHRAAAPARQFETGLPYPLRRDMTRSLAQQFWLFGCDIRRPLGNLLVAFGFDRCEAPVGSRVTASRYTKVLDTGEALILWGFGLYWSDPHCGDIYLPRHHFAPCVRERAEPPCDAWEPRDIQRLVTPSDKADVLRCQRLVLGVTGWMSAYETFVLRVAGAHYRDQAICAWKKPCGIAAEFAGMWRQRASDLTTAFD